jgi:hypothetical protein
MSIIDKISNWWHSYDTVLIGDYDRDLHRLHNRIIDLENHIVRLRNNQMDHILQYHSHFSYFAIQDKWEEQGPMGLSRRSQLHENYINSVEEEL